MLELAELAVGERQEEPVVRFVHDRMLDASAVALWIGHFGHDAALAARHRQARKESARGIDVDRLTVDHHRVARRCHPGHRQPVVGQSDTGGRQHDSQRRNRFDHQHRAAGFSGAHMHHQVDDAGETGGVARGEAVHVGAIRQRHRGPEQAIVTDRQGFAVQFQHVARIGAPGDDVFDERVGLVRTAGDAILVGATAEGQARLAQRLQNLECGQGYRHRQALRPFVGHVQLEAVETSRIRFVVEPSGRTDDHAVAADANDRRRQ